MKRLQSPRCWLVVSLLSALLPLTATAQTWTGAGGNANVSTAGNWNSGAPANDGTAALSFPTTSFAPVNFDAAYSVGSLNFSGTTGYNLSGSTLSIATGISDSATVNIIVNNPIQLSGASTFTNSSGSSSLNFFNAISLGAHNLTLSAPSAGAFSVTGNITGSGGLTVSGGSNAVTFLSGTGNNYSGGTTISSGVLQIGDPGSTSSGSLPGDVTNNGKLNFKPAAGGYTYGGVISGSGSLQKLGPNSLTLNGASTYLGFTNIDQGTLQIGVDNALPAGTTLNMNGVNSPVFNMANNQTIAHFGGTNSTGASIILSSGKALTVKPTSSLTNTSFDGTISGSGGSLVIDGVSGSKVSFSGSNSFTGGTTVNGGQLGIHNTSGSAVGSGLRAGDRQQRRPN